MSIKQLADANKGKLKPEDYITNLPASPAGLLASHPHVAAKLFDKTNLPVPCPIDRSHIAAVRNRMKLRPQRGLPPQAVVQATSGGAHVTPQQMMAGLCKHTRICMHACLLNSAEIAIIIAVWHSCCFPFTLTATIV